MAENGLVGSSGVPEALDKIEQALRIVHDPASSNESRRDAQAYLENVKENPESPLHGYRLASDKAQGSFVRHFALSILEHAIRYQWASYNEEQAVALRNWVVELNQAVSSSDPPFLRNKTAQLWVEIAKRSWGDEWMNMDSMLMQMWEVPDSSVHKEAVLFILETLSDEVFTGDDAVVAFREGVLSKACVEIFTPLSVLLECFPNRQAGPDVRQGTEGWLSRLSAFLEYCLTSEAKENDEVKSCAVKGLSAFLSLMPWAIPKAIAAAKCVDVLCLGLKSSNIEAQKLSLEALYALFGRTNFNDEEFLALVAPMYSRQSIELLRSIYDWATVDPEDIDDDKYQVLKKLAELLSPLGDYFQRKNSKLPAESASNEFLHLLVHVAQSQSLMVSIPVLVAWNVILGRGALGEGAFRENGMITTVIGPLLELSCSRLVRYENLPDDSNDPTFLFLMEDTDTLPERHAFLGNYRRYSSMIIESIVQLQLNEAISHVLVGTEEVLSHLYEGQASFNKQSYSKHSMPVLRVDARFTVIEACLKGYMKWRKHHKDDPDSRQQCSQLESNLETWCQKLLAMSFEDPMIRKRTLQLLVYFSTTALKHNTDFMLKVLEHILMTWPTVEPDYRAYNDAIKDLQSESMVELQRLASEMPDHLLNVYEQIEARVNEMISSGTLDEKRSIAYRSFLFIIIHRASQVDTQSKIQKLREFIDPVKAQWQTEDIRTSLKSYDNFCQLLGLDKAQAYLANKRAHEISDWGSAMLDEEGLALQAELDERLKALPLRPTKSFLAFSVERLDKSSAAFQASYALWQEGFPSILADLLEFLGFAHAAHNPDNWGGLPTDMRGMVSRVLSDRFWQAGISDGSKDDFYARVMDKKNTMEGLASSIRGSVRFVRETAYAIIYCMSRLDGQFYGCEGLSGPLSRALFADSIWLSTHQQSNLLNLVRYLVDDCPVEYREQFLPQLLAACFQQMDTKINGEWEKLAQQQSVSADGDDALKEEMKAESILRQVTYTAVVMVADFLDPNKPIPRSRKLENGEMQANGATEYPSLRKFCLARQEVAEPLLLFCLHGTRMRDHRCCSMVLRLFVSLIPEFRSDEHRDPHNPSGPAPQESPTTVAIRDFIALDVLQACITSFHEPYFVELQKDLATLIASILVYYSPVTSKPREVILSLPNINPAALDRLSPYIAKPHAHVRQQRAIVLDLLKDLKGVSVSEMGKMQKSGLGGNNSVRRTGGARGQSGGGNNGRSRMAQQFMQSQTEGDGNMAARGAAAAAAVAAGGDRKTTPDGLEGVSTLFELQG